MSTVKDMFEDKSPEGEQYYGKYAGLRLDPTSEGAVPEPEGAVLRGEILVEIPGLLEEIPNKEDGGQRPLQAWAKPCFPPGFFMIPKIGAQLWIEFVAGDINFPIWSGAWYPDQAAPHTVDKQSPTEHQKVIRTTGDHLIQLDDTKDEEKIVIAHKGGAKLEIDKDGSILIADQTKTFVFLNAKDGEVTIFDQHKNLITMKSDGVLVTTPGSFIELKGGKMKVTSDQAVQISANDVIINASKISLGGDAAKLSLLVAEKFLALFDAHVHPHPMGPTLTPTPPLSPMSSTMTSQAVKVI